MESSKDRIVRYLQDAHAAEIGIAKMLEGFADGTEAAEVKSLFREHVAMTRSQADRLEQRLRQFNEDVSGSKGFFNSLMAKMGDMLQGAHDDYDKTTQDLIKAYATEHLERGMYASLIAYATAAGDTETVTVAEQILQEEVQTAERLFPMISRYATLTYQAATAGGGKVYTS